MDFLNGPKYSLSILNVKSFFFYASVNVFIHEHITERATQEVKKTLSQIKKATIKCNKVIIIIIIIIIIVTIIIIIIIIIIMFTLLHKYMVFPHFWLILINSE